MTATTTPPAAKTRRAITPTQIAALAVKNENPPVDAAFLAGGGVMPADSIKDAARRFGWPIGSAEIEMPVSSENPKLTTGRVTLVPETWLRRIAEILQLPWNTACRGVVNPE